MNKAIWIIQIVLALMFVMAGIMKSTQPREKLVKNLPWVSDYPFKMVRLIGVSELLGSIGIIFPLLTSILPVFTPLAAAGLAIVMILAARHYISKSEFKEMIFNTILFVLLVIVAIYRF